MAQPNVMDVAMDVLATYLSSSVPGLTVYQQWPYANEKLEMPSITMTSNKPKRTPLMPEEVSRTDPNDDGLVVANENVAFWEDTFQLDLWTADKAQRNDIKEKVLTAFTAQNPDGLSLVLADHFHEVARFEIDATESVDDEASAERQERREKITVLVNCREIRQRTYYAMKKVQVVQSVSTSDGSGTETKTVQ